MAEEKPKRPRASRSRAGTARQKAGDSPQSSENAGSSEPQPQPAEATSEPKAMSRDQEPSAQERAESAFDVVSAYLHPGRENVMLIYILYLAGLVPAFGGVPIIVGFVMAFLNRSDADGVWASHYEYQFRQAAIGLLFIVVSAILTIVLVGIVGIVLTFVWWIIRSVKGMQAASRDEPISDPRSYSW
jgi:uncharacterized membrane protein